MDQDNVIIFRIFICSDHFIVELFKEHIIFQLAVTQFQKKLLVSSGHFRVKRELHIQHVFPYRSQQCLLEDIKIFKRFLLRKRQECVF